MWFLLGSDHRRGNVHLCIRFIFNCSVKLCSLIHNESRRLFSRCLTASEIPALCLITTCYTHTQHKELGQPHTHTQQCARFLPPSSPWSLENSSFNKLLIIFFRSIRNQLFIGIIRPQNSTYLAKLVDQFVPRAIRNPYASDEGGNCCLRACLWLMAGLMSWLVVSRLTAWFLILRSTSVIAFKAIVHLILWSFTLAYVVSNPLF